MTKYEYRVREENDDPYQQVIEKSGITAKFTLAQLEEEHKQIERKIEELDGQRRVEDAKCKNVEKNHPEVMEYEPELRSYIMTYQEAVQKRSQAADLIKMFKDALVESQAEMDTIKKDLKIPEHVK